MANNIIGNRMTADIARQEKLAQAVARTQISISTGKRIQIGSEDPVAAQRIGQLRQMQADEAVWGRTVKLGQSLAGQANIVLSSLSDHMTRAYELAVSAGTVGVSQTDRDAIATELRAIADEVDGLAKTQSSLGGDLFASGQPVSFRFDSATVFAPVPNREQIFQLGGVSLGDSMRAVAAKISLGTSAAQTEALTALDATSAHIADQLAQVGLNAARIDRANESNANRGLALAEERSGLEDTDLSAAIAQLNAQTLTLQAAQATFARINRQSLFDLLR